MATLANGSTFMIRTATGFVTDIEDGPTAFQTIATSVMGAVASVE